MSSDVVRKQPPRERGTRELSENSTVQMQAVIGLLLKGAEVSQISAELEIPKARILRWYRDSADFQQMLEATEADVVSRLRDAIAADVTDLVADLLPDAQRVLAESLSAESPSIRLQAAAHVFRLTGQRSTDGFGAKPRPVTNMESHVRALDARPAAGD